MSTEMINKEASIKEMMRDVISQIVDREKKQTEKALKDLERANLEKEALKRRQQQIEEEEKRAREALDPFVKYLAKAKEAQQEILKELYEKDDLQPKEFGKIVQKGENNLSAKINKIDKLYQKARKRDKHGIYNKEVNQKVAKMLSAMKRMKFPEHEKEMKKAMAKFKANCKKAKNLPSKKGMVSGVFISGGGTGFPNKGTLKVNSVSDKAGGGVQFLWYEAKFMNTLLSQGVFTKSWRSGTIPVEARLMKLSPWGISFFVIDKAKKGSMKLGRNAKSTFNPKMLAGYKVKPHYVESVADDAKRGHGTRRASEEQLFNLRKAATIHLSHHPELRADVLPLLETRTASQSELRERMIRLAYEKKELRPHLVPLVHVFG